MYTVPEGVSFLKVYSQRNLTSVPCQHETVCSHFTISTRQLS